MLAKSIPEELQMQISMEEQVLCVLGTQEEREPITDRVEANDIQETSEPDH